MALYMEEEEEKRRIYLRTQLDGEDARTLAHCPYHYYLLIVSTSLFLSFLCACYRISCRSRASLPYRGVFRFFIFTSTPFLVTRTVTTYRHAHAWTLTRTRTSHSLILTLVSFPLRALHMAVIWDILRLAHTSCRVFLHGTTSFAHVVHRPPPGFSSVACALSCMECDRATKAPFRAGGVDATLLSVPSVLSCPARRCGCVAPAVVSCPCHPSA